MNEELLVRAKERVPSIPVLINMLSKRVRQLNAGFRPYIKPASPDEEKINIALREIAEGAIVAEMSFTEPDLPPSEEIGSEEL